MLQRTYDKYRLLDVKTRHDEDVTEEESRLEDDLSCHYNQKRSGHQNISPFDQNSNKLEVTKLLKNSFEKFRNIEKVEAIHKRNASNNNDNKIEKS